MDRQEKYVCELNKCTGCMACAAVCPKSAVSVDNGLAACNAVIDGEKCVDCGACYRACQINEPTPLKKPTSWYQGWARDEQIRADGASGGAAGAIALAFVKNGGVVYSCTYRNGEFIFARAENEQELPQFAGSRYVKSDMSGVYERIKKDISDRKVLFIGLGCQVSGVQRVIKNDNLYTIDIICHGTPSAKLLELYLNQKGYRLSELEDIRFREKCAASGKKTTAEKKCSAASSDVIKSVRLSGAERKYTYVAAEGVRDAYTLAFLNSLSLTENCYECHYAGLSRVSDLTLGDSWGSGLPLEVSKNGLSLILCQTEKGAWLLKRADLELVDVSVENAVSHNEQLKNPTRRPQERDEFIEEVNSGKSMEALMRRILPKQYFKQRIKRVLTAVGINRLRKRSTIEYAIRVLKH